MAGYLPGLDTTRPSSMDLENPPPPPPPPKLIAAVSICCLVLLSLGLTACIAVPIMLYIPEARYSVAIDSASALDPRAGVSFNLTLGITSRSRGKACIDTGMYVQVFYRGVQLAASDAAGTRRTCARRPNVAEVAMVARATMQPVGDMLDRLAAELGQGAALFDLRLLAPTTTKVGEPYLAVSGCKATRVGDAAVPCDTPT